MRLTAADAAPCTSTDHILFESSCTSHHSVRINFQNALVLEKGSQIKVACGCDLSEEEGSKSQAAKAASCQSNIAVVMVIVGIIHIHCRMHSEQSAT